MKLYLSHASNYDYGQHLYEPFRRSIAREHQVVFPHDDFIVNTREVIAGSNLVLAEVSRPSTGQGIELGWANASGVQIVCFYRNGMQYSGSLPFVSETFIGYDNEQEMIAKLSGWLREYQDVVRI